MLTAFAEPFPMPIPQHPYGRRIEDIPSDIRTWDGWRPVDAINLANPPPRGWYSVGHWSALVEPGIFHWFEQPIAETLAEMEAEAVAACRREGIEPIRWPAPPALAASGVDTVLLIPDPILRDVTRI